MELDNPNLSELTYALSTFSNPLTQRITDYLAGYQLGPRGAVQTLVEGQDIKSAEGGQSIEYWTGPMLPRTHARYAEMVGALLKSFNFRNIVQEGVEFLADGVGADEADWSLVSELDTGDGKTPLPTQEQALLDEAEQLLTALWDNRDLPTTLQTLLQTAIAHGRATLRARIPARFRDDQGKLRLNPDPMTSLDALHFVLPDVGFSGIYVDPETLHRIGVTQVFYVNATVWKSEWEVTHVDDQGKTILQTISSGTQPVASDPLDLGGRLWLFELLYPRPAVTRDVLSNQDALNVGLTMLSRNTHFAGFAQVYGIGIDPPTTEDGTKVVPSGPGSQSFFQPSVSVETTDTMVDGTPVRTVRETAYKGAQYGKLDPTDPKAIEAAIDMAETNIYSSLRQRFVLMDDKATASGRSREVATGSFLRATARYASGMEYLIRNVLEFSLALSAIIQGQPGKYKSLRASVTCRQQVFDPAPQTLEVGLKLQQAGVISKQTLMAQAGIADPDAELARIAEEAAPEKPPPAKPPAKGDEPPTPN